MGENKPNLYLKQCEGFIFRISGPLVSAEICIERPLVSAEIRIVEQNFRDLGRYVTIPGQVTVMIPLEFMCFEGRVCLTHL